VDRAAAEQLAKRLNRDHPERETHTWFPRESGDEWIVVKAPLPPGIKREAVGASIEQPDQVLSWTYDHRPDARG
jgi:hypothetical protein